MKIVIVGAGATGAFLGARMARAGVDVTLVARGAHLAAMRERGVEVREADGHFVPMRRFAEVVRDAVTSGEIPPHAPTFSDGRACDEVLDRLRAAPFAPGPVDPS